MPRRAGGRKQRGAVAEGALDIDAFSLKPDAWDGFSSDLVTFLERRKGAVKDLGNGENKFLDDCVQSFLACKNENQQARAVGSIKHAIKGKQLSCRDDQCICRGTVANEDSSCQAYLQASKLALAICCSPCKKKLRRLSCALLSLCFETFPTLFENQTWRTVFSQEVTQVLDLVRNSPLFESERENENILEHAGTTLSYLLSCEPTCKRLLQVAGSSELLRVSISILEKLRDGVMSSVEHEASSASDQSEKGEQLDGIMHFLLSLLEQVAAEQNVEDNLSLVPLLESLRDSIFVPLMCSKDLASILAFKPFRNHAAVALVRMNSIVVNTSNDLGESVLHLLGLTTQPKGFLAPFTVDALDPETHAILLHQVIGALPANVLFHPLPQEFEGQAEASFLAGHFVKQFRLLSESNIFEENVQTACLKGLSSWCRQVREGLESPSLRSVLWTYWLLSARDTCCSLIDFVLANWSHGERKARYHLEPLLQGAIALLDFVRLDLKELQPDLDSLASQLEKVEEINNLLLARLIREIVDHDPQSMKTNLKAALPIVTQRIKQEGIAKLIQVDRRVIDGLIRCFSQNAHVGRVAANVFLEAVKALEGGGFARSVWLNPLAAAMLGDLSAAVSDGISTELLPRLIRSVPDLTSESFLDAFGQGAGYREKVMIWITFRDAGMQIRFIESPSTESPNHQSMGEGVLYVPSQDVQRALMWHDPVTAVKALDLITCLQSSKLYVPDREQLELCKYFFARMTKWPHSSLRHYVVRDAVKLIEWIVAAASNEKIARASVAELSHAVTFVQWLLIQLVSCTYPLVPLDRAGMGLEILLEVLRVLTHPSAVVAHRLVNELCGPQRGFLYPFVAMDEPGHKAKDMVMALVNSLMNAYEKVQNLSFNCLRTLPSPFPGLSSRHEVQDWLHWMIMVLSSSRVRDTDAGASMIRLLYVKYVSELGWAIDIQGSASPGWLTALSPASEGDVDDAFVLAARIRDRVDVAIMHLACDEAEKCERSENAYCVGSLVFQPQAGYHVEQARGFSRELPGNTHAEETAFMKIGRLVRSSSMKGEDDDVAYGEAKGSTIYTTMEPCSVRLSGNRPCTSRCIAAGVSRVVVGVREPSKFVTCTGTQELRDAGIRVDYLQDPRVQRRCMEPNMFLFPGEEDTPNQPLSESERAEANAQAQGMQLPAADTRLHFMWQLVGLLKNRAATLQLVHSQSVEPPASEERDDVDDVDGDNGDTDFSLLATAEGGSLYGILRAIRYCWEDTKVFTQDWRPLVNDLLQTVLSLMELAQKIVGGPSDGEKGKQGKERTGEEEDDDEEEEESSKGKSHLPVSGLVQGLEESEDHETNTPSHSTSRKIVVSSWLLVRDGSELLQAIVQNSPLQERRGSESATPWIVSFEDVQRIGDWILNSLRSLKHVGAIGYSVLAFQGVCSTLLALKRLTSNGQVEEDATKTDHLIELPRMWLRTLLDRLEMGTQGFVLRRSSGFAGSFLALARSEPRSFKSSLLSEMMQRLIRLASEDSTVVLGTRVHAMNIIKVVIQDATLQTEIDGSLLSDVFVLSINGFCSPHWQVRNSSMMIYAQLVKRVLAGNHQGDEETVGSRMAASFFFRRYPKVQQAVLDGLRGAVSTRAEASREPRLYPWLLLLSRLEPRFLLGSSRAFLHVDLTEEEVESWLKANEDVEDFLPLLVKCSVHPEGLTRTMAARALGSLTPNTHLLPMIRDSLERLHKEQTRGAFIPFNILHGTLLCVQHLVKAVENRKVFVDIQEEYGVSSLDEVDAVVHVVQDLDVYFRKGLQSALELVDSSRHIPCLAVSDSVWDVFQGWVELRERTLPNLELSPELLALVHGRATSGPVAPVGIDLVQKPMALACRFFPDLLSSVLTSQNELTRLAAMKLLRSNAHGALTGQGLRHSLEALMEVCFRPGPQYPPELEARLDLIGHVVEQMKVRDQHAILEELDMGSLFQVVLKTYDEAETDAIQCPALFALGTLQSVVPDSADVLAERFLDACQPLKTSPLREVACKSLSQSRLLVRGNLTDHARFCAWSSLLVMLQDEVDAVRVEAVTLANSVVPELSESGQLMSEPEAFASTYRYAGQVLGSYPAWVEKCNLLLAGEATFGEVVMSVSSSCSSDLGLQSKDLFLFEPDNVYAEVILEAAQASLLMQDKASNLSSQDLEELRMVVANTKWTGGPTFQPDLYRAIFLSALRCSRNTLENLYETLGGDEGVMHPHLRQMLTQQQGSLPALLAYLQ